MLVKWAPGCALLLFGIDRFYPYIISPGFSLAQGQSHNWLHGAREATLGLYSRRGTTSYRKLSQSFEAARFGVNMIISFWNLTDAATALLSKRPWNFRAIGQMKSFISRPRDFTRFDGNTSYRSMNRGPGRREWINLVTPSDAYMRQ